MIRVAFATLLLAIVVVIQTSVISVLPIPVNRFPLVFLLGVLIFHFVRPIIGVLWLILGGIMLDLIGFSGIFYAISFSAAAFIGIPLTYKLFTNKSIYAMLGLGLVMYTVSLLFNMFFFLIHNVQTGVNLSVSSVLPIIWHSYLLFLFGLVISFFMSKRIDSTLRTIFLLRKDKIRT